MDPSMIGRLGSVPACGPTPDMLWGLLLLAFLGLGAMAVLAVGFVRALDSATNTWLAWRDSRPPKPKPPTRF